MGLRDFVDDVGTGTIASLSLVVGLALGAAGTYYLTAGTPFSQADMDRVSVVERPLVEGDVAVDASLTDVRQLTKDLKDARHTIDGLQDEIYGLQDENAVLQEAQVESASTATDVGDPGESGLTISGTLASSWILTSQLKPWPSDCSGMVESYQVRIKTGDHGTVAIGTPVSAKVTKRSEKGGVLTLSCAMTYRATLPGSVADVYEFVAVSAGEPGEPLASVLVQGTEIAGGQAPELFFTFCPEC